MQQIDKSDPCLEDDRWSVAPLASPRFWWPAYGAIRSEGGGTTGLFTPDRRPIEPNILQMELLLHFEYLFLGLNEDMTPTPEGPQPTRIIGVKPRKTGLSTCTQGIFYWMHRAFQTQSWQGRILPMEFQSIVMAQDQETTEELRDMFERYAEHDTYVWPKTVKVRRKQNKMIIGTGLSRVSSALSAGAGRGKTPNASHYTESAHYPNAGKRDAKTMMLGRINSIPKQPGTIIIAESTPFGASGWHHDTYHGNNAAHQEELKRGAVPLTDWKQGERGNGWVKLFCPWYRFAKHRLDVTPEQAEKIMASLIDEEARCVELYGVDAGQIAWRRMAVADCGGESGFLQEYPEDDISCFTVSGRPYFARKGLDRVQKLIKDNAVPPRYGRLDGRGISNGTNRVRFRETSQIEGQVVIWEMPRRGVKYLLVADTATGADVVKDARISDRHSVWVIREGAVDGDRHSRPMAVARIACPFQDATSLAIDRTLQLAEFYGGCTVVVEANNSGLSWLSAMTALGVTLYHREVQDEESREWKKKVGWMTTTETRRLPLDALERVIREGTADFFCPNAINECRTTVYHTDGKIAGANGKHDDDVMALGIGFFLINGGHGSTCVTPGGFD